MSRHLRFKLKQKSPELLTVLEVVRSAMKRIPEQILDPSFWLKDLSGRSRPVTVHHITRVVAKRARDVTVVDGWFTDRRGKRMAHSWLATQSTSYLIEVLPRELVADPFLVCINGLSSYFEAYQADDDATSDFEPNQLEQNVVQLLDLIQSIEVFLALP